MPTEVQECQECQAKISPEDNFCDKCGAKLARIAPTPPATGTPGGTDDVEVEELRQRLANAERKARDRRLKENELEQAKQTVEILRSDVNDLEKRVDETKAALAKAQAEVKEKEGFLKDEVSRPPVTNEGDGKSEPTSSTGHKNKAVKEPMGAWVLFLATGGAIAAILQPEAAPIDAAIGGGVLFVLGAVVDKIVKKR